MSTAWRSKHRAGSSVTCLASWLGIALALLPGPVAAESLVDCVLAKVNEEVITLSDYNAHKKAILEDIYRRKLPEDKLKTELEQAGRELLPSLIEEKLLAQKARELKLSVDKAEVDRIVKSIMEQNSITDEADLERRLQTENMTLAALRQNIEKRTLLEKLKQFEITSKVVVTEEEGERFFAEHKEDYREPERVRLREVVLLTEGRDADQVRKEIEEIGGLIKNGADFAELAALFSQAPTAEQGGDLGLVKTADLAAEIAEAASRLEVGQVSPPVHSKYGFHILMLVERKPTSYQKLEQVKDRVTRRIQESRLNEKMESYVAGLKQAAFIKVNESCEASLR